ncbi:MAG: zf-HC2 domain-containing protein [Ignavibacteriales bacterium]
MPCYDSSILRAYIDKEISHESAAKIARHLEECGDCTARYEEILNNDKFVSSMLAEHLDETEMHETIREEAWAKLNAGIKNQKKRRLMELSTKYRRIAAAAAITICLVGSMSFGNVRNAVGEFLSVFRVEKIQTISITPQEMAQIQDAIEKGVGRIDIEKFGSLEAVGKEEALNNTTLAEAEKTAGFKVLTPQAPGYDKPVINVQKFARKDLTLNIEYVNDLIAKLGGSKLLPAELDGKTFSISMSPLVDITYNSEEAQPPISLVAMRSPEMAVPGGVEVAEVRDALLGLPFWPSEIKQQLTGINDWQHTMLLPDAGQTSKVAVRGSQGVFFQDPSKYQSQLIWLENGVVYSLIGPLSQDKAVEIAESLK